MTTVDSEDFNCNLQVWLVFDGEDMKCGEATAC